MSLVRPSEHSKRPLSMQPLVSPASTRGKAKRVRPSKAPLEVPRQSPIVLLVTGGRALLLLTKTGKGVLVYKCPGVIRLPWAQKRFRICWDRARKGDSASGLGRGSRCRCLSAPEPILFLFGRLQNLERAKQALVDTHHSTSIVEFTAVVWCTEQCDQLTL